MHLQGRENKIEKEDGWRGQYPRFSVLARDANGNGHNETRWTSASCDSALPNTLPKGRLVQAA